MATKDGEPSFLLPGNTQITEVTSAMKEKETSVLAQHSKLGVGAGQGGGSDTAGPKLLSTRLCPLLSTNFFCGTLLYLCSFGPKALPSLLYLPI